MNRSTNPHNLDRFVSAQSGTFERALTEIRSGRKQTHWMWFVLPQLRGLGSSIRATQYGIGSVEEARAYLDNPILGPRLVECTQAALDVENRSATEIFGTPDDTKLRSCATLFAHISPAGSVFHQIIDKYYEGEPDPKTLTLLARSGE